MSSFAENRGIFPAPQILRIGAAQAFRLGGNAIAVSCPPGLRRQSAVLAASLSKESGASVRWVSPALADIRIERAAIRSSSTEGFEILIDGTGVRIQAAQPPGICRGIQAFLQFLAHHTEEDSEGPWTWLPETRIEDEPALAWRGMHLDIARHFYPANKIKRMVDLLALHRMNVLQLHMTDDQGWRIESRLYPRLTEIGAWRDESPLRGDRDAGDGAAYGGFLTQEDIVEIVRYAADRGIEVVPEIDIPGHGAALLEAYPHLGNDDIGDYNPKVLTRWGIHPWTLAPKSETFEFIEALFGEIAGLFPGPHFHLGGDEVVEKQWRSSPRAQAFIRARALKGELGLFEYFIQFTADVLKRKGRQVIGWDEILDVSPPDAIVMVWRNWETAVRATRQGRQVILAPKTHMYFDYYQGNSEEEPEAIGGLLPLEQVAAMEPSSAADEDGQHLILGVQGQLWSEYMPEWRDVEYMALPRMSALAQVAWTGRATADYEGFLDGLHIHLARLKRLGYRFRPVGEHASAAVY